MKVQLPPIGFWSYARRDDELSDGNLTRLRDLIKRELQLQFGRDDIILFQDTTTIPHGANWEKETFDALGQATFFIPIITPNFIQSEWCARETEFFLKREEELFSRHPDLPPQSRIFPIDYRRIRDGNARNPAVLAALRKRQWCEFKDVLLEELTARPVRAKIYEFAESICDLLLVEVEAPPSPDELARREAEIEAERKREAAAKRREAAAARKARGEQRKREAALAASAENLRTRREREEREKQAADQKRANEEAAAAAAREEEAAKRSAEAARQEEELEARAAEAKKQAEERARRDAGRRVVEQARRDHEAKERARHRRALMRRLRGPVTIGGGALIAALALGAYFLFLPEPPPSPQEAAAENAQGPKGPRPSIAAKPVPDRAWLRGDWGSGSCAVPTAITLTARGFDIRYRGTTVRRIVDEARSTDRSIVTDQERFVRDGNEVQVMEGEQMAYRLVRCGR